MNTPFVNLTPGRRASSRYFWRDFVAHFIAHFVEITEVRRSGATKCETKCRKPNLRCANLISFDLVFLARCLTAVIAPCKRWVVVIILLPGLLAAVGCRQEMYNQPGHKPLQASSFFKDGMSARPLPFGTVPRGFLHTNVAFSTGLEGTNLVENIPLPVTRALLERGRERYDIYCSVCHDQNGDGNGMVVQRGFPRPPSYHIDRLRQAPSGHFYRVMTYGYGVMYSYATRVSPEDRWAITAYIRALQFSRNAPAAALASRDTPQAKESAQ